MLTSLLCPCDLSPWGFVGTPHENVGLYCLEMWIPPQKGSSCLVFFLSLPSLRLSPSVEPSSTVVSLEWLDVQPAIGTKVSDYVLQHKKVDEYTDTDLYTGGCEGGQPPGGAEGSWLCFLCPACLGARLWWRMVPRAKVLHETSNPLHLGEVSGIFCRHGYLRGRGFAKTQ